MTTAVELLREGRYDEVWKKYCGFLDLKIDNFMDIQERLLMEQIYLLSKSELGRSILGPRIPANVKEFRELVPLTKYEDYPYLLERREDVLPVKPRIWARTSGRSSDTGCKWAPYTKEMIRKVGEFSAASFLLASASERGDVRLREGDVCVYTMAPAPYFSGAGVATGFLEELNPKFIPSMEEGSKMSFEERIAVGFRLAMKEGIDLFYGLSSVLVAIAQQFEKGSGNTKLSADMLHPALISRVVKAMLKSKLGGRPMLPKDLWKVKGIVAGGMDTSFFSSAIESYWGRKPLEGYGGTEISGIALQTWTFKGMTFLPDCNYLEFIPMDDFYKNRDDPSFNPRTFSLDEVKLGVYELVITNFHGNLFTRYRTGDLVKIFALRDDEINVDIPQMTFYARADGVMDISGFTRLTEKTIWQAINESNIANAGWTAHKEYQDGKPVMHLYIESTNGMNTEEARQLIHTNLKRLDSDYTDLVKMLDSNPLQVSRLAPGTFNRYMEVKRKAGADLAILKPPKVNPKESVLELLLSLDK
jgi:hypothetical protein